MPPGPRSRVVLEVADLTESDVVQVLDRWPGYLIASEAQDRFGWCGGLVQMPGSWLPNRPIRTTRRTSAWSNRDFSRTEPGLNATTSVSWWTRPW
jgi:hypothetical protein